MARFEYEQCPARGRWVYKFDHTPNEDGAWHRLNANVESLYRIARGVLQFVEPVDLSDEERIGVLEALVTYGPLRTDDELEIVLATTKEGWVVSSRLAPTGIRFATLAELDEAYAALKAVEHGQT